MWGEEVECAAAEAMGFVGAGGVGVALVVVVVGRAKRSFEQGERMSEVAVAVAVAGWFGAAIGFHQATCEASETAVLTARTCIYKGWGGAEVRQ